MAREIRLKPCACGAEGPRGPGVMYARVAEDAEETWVECPACGRATEPLEDAYADYAGAADDWNRGRIIEPKDTTQ